MLILKTAKEMNNFISKSNNKKMVGFVPTMGALHNGHLELVKKSVLENNITVVSIFVNPTQFNNKKDLEKYPRTVLNDLNLLKKVKCDVVFIPSENEIYPEIDDFVFDLNGLDTVMEGKYRHGHFNGVAQIVSILFDIVMPQNAYFGKKDFQQLAIIKFITNKYFSNKSINIVGCNIVRENDGLAMSSRNVRLTNKQRELAPIIYSTLNKYVNINSDLEVKDIIKNVIDEINSCSILKVEYFDIVDNKTLKTIKQNKLQKGFTACIAVFAGDIRLIDNISI